MGVFEHLAADDSDRRTAQRQSTAVAWKRVSDRFGAYLAVANSPSERTARLNVARGDIQEVIASACSEYGGDPDSIGTSIFKRLTAVEEETSERTASVHEARRPKMCPYHKEVTDISLASGDPASGFNAMAQHAWGAQHCQGEGYEGRCNFKPAMTTQKYWDDKAEQAETRKRERQEQLELQQQDQGFDQVPDDASELGEVTEPVADSGIDAELSEAPSAVGEGAEPAATLEPMAASTREAAPPVVRPGVDPNTIGVGGPADQIPQGPMITRPTQAPVRPGTVPPQVAVPAPAGQPQQADALANPVHPATPGVGGLSPAQQSAQALRQQIQQRPNFQPGQYNVEHFQGDKLKNPRGPGVRAKVAQQPIGDTPGGPVQPNLPYEHDLPERPEDEPETIDLEPNWDGMRAWVTQLEQTDPEIAEGIKQAMGNESPDMQFSDTELRNAQQPGYEDQPLEPGANYTQNSEQQDLPPGNYTAKTAEALETVEVDQGSAKDGSPKIDKGTWDPYNRGESGNPIKTEQEGSPHPTETIDPLEAVVPENNESDFLEGTRAVTETQDVEKQVDTEAKTDYIWGGNNGTSPVTSSEDNPIRDLMEKGLLPENQVEAAIKEFEDA